MATTYTVQGGDSYWSIAGALLGNQRFFAQISNANNGVNLHPGMVIKIPDVDTSKEPIVSVDEIAFSNLQDQRLALAGSTNPFAGFDPNALTPFALARFNELGVDPFQTLESLRVIGGIPDTISPQFAAALRGADAGGIGGGTTIEGAAPLTAQQQVAQQSLGFRAGIEAAPPSIDLPELTTPGGATVDLTGGQAVVSENVRRPQIPGVTPLAAQPFSGGIEPLEPAAQSAFASAFSAAQGASQNIRRPSIEAATPSVSTEKVSQNVRRPDLTEFRGPGIVQIELRSALQQIADGSLDRDGPEMEAFKNELIQLGLVSPDSSPFTAFGSDRYNFRFLSLQEARVYMPPRRQSRRVSGSIRQTPGPVYSSGAVSRAIRWRMSFG